MTWFFAQCILWGVYFPLLILVRGFLFFVPPVKERLKFERKNASEPGAQSFAGVGSKADLCFEFSSEGEYQQVASLIDDALLDGKLIELVFFSPSVEKSILDLYQRFPGQIRYLRYPILNIFFSKWVTSDQLILVRYDLFPEFFIWSLKPGRKLKFVWVTFKKERMKGKGISFFKRIFLLRSDFTVFASEEDYRQGQGIGIKGVFYDFRMVQIKRRLEKRNQKFTSIFPQYQQLKSLLETYPRSHRLIMGNAWPVDVELLKKIPSDYILVIVPHKLDSQIIEEMKKKIEEIGRSLIVIADSSQEVPKETSLLINKKGILCELYADFGKAYVGGGFGVSIHSVLEPLVAGCDSISCGPINQRSTEYDVAVECGQIKEVKNFEDFSSWLAEDLSNQERGDKIRIQIERYPHFQKEVLTC